MKPITTERNPLGDFSFFRDFVIAEWLKPAIDNFDLVLMETVAKSIYGDRPWGYISNRTHVTVSNPSALHFMMRQQYAPSAVAVVTYSIRSRMIALLEQDQCKTIPMEIFDRLEHAVEWMTETMESSQEDTQLIAT